MKLLSRVSEFLFLFSLVIPKLPWKLIFFLMILKVKVECLMPLRAWLTISFKFKSHYLLLVHSFYWFLELQRSLGCSLYCLKIIKKKSLDFMYFFYFMTWQYSISKDSNFATEIFYFVDARSIEKLQKDFLITALVINCICSQENLGGSLFTPWLLQVFQTVLGKRHMNKNKFQALIWNALFCEMGCSSTWVML